MKTVMGVSISARALALVALAAFAGCKSEDEPASLVPIDITAAADLTDLLQVRGVIRDASAEYVNRIIAWPGGSSPLQVGYHVPNGINGTLLVSAEGLGTNGV